MTLIKKWFRYLEIKNRKALIKINYKRGRN